MRLKLMSVVTGMIAGAAIATVPLTALAQNSTQQTPAPQTPAPQTPAPQTQQSRPRIVLSAEQETKFKQLQANAIKQIGDVLSADQKKQFAEGLESGRGLGAIQNLSTTQESRIRTILDAFNTQVGDILTPEQKRQIQQNRQSQ